MNISIFLPYCLKREMIERLKNYAEKKGCRVYVIKSSKEEKGFSKFKRIVEEDKPEIIFGSACLKEIKKIEEYLNQRNIFYKAMRLSKERCDGGDIDENEFRRVLDETLDNKI